jgi:hypothetical protein
MTKSDAAGVLWVIGVLECKESQSDEEQIESRHQAIGNRIPHRYSCIPDAEGLDSGIECSRLYSQQLRGPVWSIDLAVAL